MQQPTTTYQVGTLVVVKQSDAPEFKARIVAVQVDAVYGDSYRVLPVGRREIWVSEFRIVGLAG
jgi:hypothetical protein